MTILPFTSPEANLEAAGGKGLNLVRLRRAGFAVPRGFIISTSAYREFVNVNRCLPTIQSAVGNLSTEDAAALEQTLITYAREHLAGYKVPRSVDVVDELPRLPTGKLYKRKLRDQYWQDAEGRAI